MIRWVNQYAYDVTWKGRRTRVRIQRLTPLRPMSNRLMREAGGR